MSCRYPSGLLTITWFCHALRFAVTVVFWRCVFGAVFLFAWCLLRGYLPDRTLSLSRLALAAPYGSG